MHQEDSRLCFTCPFRWRQASRFEEALRISMAQRHQWRLRVAAVAPATPLAMLQVLVPEL